MDSLTQNDLDRFWGKVSKEISEVFYNDERCWEWIAGREGDGYGSFYLSGKCYKAHRISWMIHFGEIPQCLGVLHHCDNPACVHPRHIFLGDHGANMADKARKGRQRNTGRRRIFGPLPPPTVKVNSSYKLSEEQVSDIRRRYAPWGRGGENMQQLATAFEVSPQEISNIVHRIRWK